MSHRGLLYGFKRDKLKSKGAVCGLNNVENIEWVENIFNFNFVRIGICFDTLDLFLLDNYLFRCGMTFYQ